MSLLSETRMDKTAFSTLSLHDEPVDDAFWHAQTPEVRLAAVELMRQIAYGYDPETNRMVKVLQTITPPEGYFTP